MTTLATHATYRVPAKLGARVIYTGGHAPNRGTITAVQGTYIYIRFDGEKRSVGPFHPAWMIEYLEDPK